MRVAIGSDHRGFRVKARLVELLTRLGHTVDDNGTHDDNSVDYPDIARTVSRNVSTGGADCGILICGSGIGMAIAANKFAGIRAATCRDEMEVEMSRRHNNANVLCLSGDQPSESRLERLVEVWLGTQFDGGRHTRRMEKIARFEQDDEAH